MGLEEWSLTISIVSAIMAIASIVQAWHMRKQTKKETDEALSFLTHLVINSAVDPDTLRRMLEDYKKVGEWRVKVFRRPDGKYSLDFDMNAQDGFKTGVKPQQQ